MKAKDTLKWIAWETTPRCNLSCVHCRSSSTMHLPETLSHENALLVLNKINAFCENPVVVLSGGEPLLRSDIFDLAAYGTDKNFRMCMATNGTLVDDTVCNEMKKTKIKMVSLSLDGSNAAIHDNFRQHKGAFNAVMNAAEILNKHGIPFLINSSFTKRNQNDIENTYKLAKKIGAKAWYMFMIVPTGRGEDVFDELISTKDYDEILRWHYKIEKQENEMLVRPTCAPHYYRIFEEEAKLENASDQRRNLTFSTGANKGCVAGQTICLIRSDGEVLPCSYFPMSGGNIFKQSLEEIWHSPLFKDMRSFKDYKGRCGSCEYIGKCGGCRARAYAVTGNYMDEEPFCDYIPKKMRNKDIK
jgi:radical SAM protein with 4Fe4S-binding SPASM domain